MLFGKNCETQKLSKPSAARSSSGSRVEERRDSKARAWRGAPADAVLDGLARDVPGPSDGADARAGSEALGEVAVVEDPLQPVVDAEGLDREGPAAGAAPEAGDLPEGGRPVGAPGDIVGVGPGGVLAVVDTARGGAEGRMELIHTLPTRATLPLDSNANNLGGTTFALRSAASPLSWAYGGKLYDESSLARRIDRRP